MHLTLIQDWSKKASFSLVTSKNVQISPLHFLIFSFNTFVTLV